MSTTATNLKHLGLHITVTRFPGQPTCTSCENLLTGRTDGMETVRVQRMKAGSKRWPTTHWLCTPCAKLEGFAR